MKIKFCLFPESSLLSNKELLQDIFFGPFLPLLAKNSDKIRPQILPANFFPPALLTFLAGISATC
jgi:hypothetical protein